MGPALLFGSEGALPSFAARISVPATGSSPANWPRRSLILRRRPGRPSTSRRTIASSSAAPDRTSAPARPTPRSPTASGRSDGRHTPLDTVRCYRLVERKPDPLLAAHERARSRKPDRERRLRSREEPVALGRRLRFVPAETAVRCRRSSSPSSIIPDRPRPAPSPSRSMAQTSPRRTFPDPAAIVSSRLRSKARSSPFAIDKDFQAPGDNRGLGLIRLRPIGFPRVAGSRRPRSASRSTLTRSRAAPTRAGRSASKIATTGVPDAAARCVMPLSLPTYDASLRQPPRQIAQVLEPHRASGSSSSGPAHQFDRHRSAPAIPPPSRKCFERPVLRRASRERMDHREAALAALHSQPRVASHPAAPSTARLRQIEIHGVLRPRWQRPKEGERQSCDRRLETPPGCAVPGHNRIESPQSLHQRSRRRQPEFQQLEARRGDRPRVRELTAGAMPSAPRSPCSLPAGTPARAGNEMMSPIAPGRISSRRIYSTSTGSFTSIVFGGRHILSLHAW